MRCWRFIMADAEILRWSIPPRSATATLAYRFASACLRYTDRSMCRHFSAPASLFCWLPPFCISYASPCSDAFPGGWDGCSRLLTWCFYTRGWESDFLLLHHQRIRPDLIAQFHKRHLRREPFRVLGDLFH